MPAYRLYSITPKCNLSIGFISIMMRSKLRIKKNIKASTLLEALVALVILIVISSFVFLILNNVNRNSNIGLKARAYNETNNIFYTSLADSDFKEQLYDFKNFEVLRIATYSPWNSELLEFKVTARCKQGRLLVEKKRLVLIPDK